MIGHSSKRDKPALLVLASTYPRWMGDHEPGFVHELSQRMASAFRVIVVTPHAAGAAREEVMDGVRVVRYRYAPKHLQTLVHGGGMAANLRRSRWKALLLPAFLIGQYMAASREIRRAGIDVIHAHWLVPQGIIARRLSKVFGIPYVVTSHGGDLFGLRGAWATRLKRGVARSSAAMSVVSSAMLAEAGRARIASPVMKVLPMGVDLKNRFFEAPGVDREPNRLLFVGRLVRKKGLTHLLGALPRVLASKPDVTLDIAGFGPEEAALRAQAISLGIAHAVDFLGAMPQEQLPALYRRAAAFVAPFVRDESGDQEGLPVALMEAIACGCPAIVGDVPGLEDLFGQEFHQRCVQARDPAALSEAILAVLDNPNASVLQARELRAVVAEKVDWNAIADAYADLLSQAMKGSRDGRQTA